MAELDLYDNLELEEYKIVPCSGEVSVHIKNGGGRSSSVLNDIPVEKNLITIAVKKYMDLINTGGQFIFSLTKNIPAGAGLGGGSSNAASALKIVSMLADGGEAALIHNAAYATGSDVPFFLEGGFAFVEGRGEIVEPIDFQDESFILLINNGIHIDTGFAYKSLNRFLSNSETDCMEKKRNITERILKKSQWKEIFKNDFEDPIFRIYPHVRLIKDRLYQNGAFFAMMTGSGSTVFGLFKNEDSAKNVQKILELEGNRVYFTKFRNRKN